MITKLSTSEEASYRFRGVFQLTYSFSKTPLINNGQRLEALPLTAKGFEPDTVPTSIKSLNSLVGNIEYFSVEGRVLKAKLFYN